MKKNRLLLTIALLTASASALADDMKTNRQTAEALQEIGTTQYEVDSATAPIRTKADLRQHLATSPRSPLYRLRDTARDAFVSSMIFTNYGLASYSFIPLQSLSVSDAYAVLSLFGEQRAVGRIPQMKARNKTEESILLVSRSGLYTPQGEGDPPPMPTEPLPHQACYVDSTNNPPQVWCEPYPGAMCNPKCR